MNDPATTQPAPANDGTRDLFLSYNSRDREAVLRVWKQLEARAVSTFLDRNDLTPGLPWQAELEAALAKVNAVAVFIGSEGIGAWQRPEKELALNRQQQAHHAGRRFPVIPVLLPDADANKVTGFLSLNTWIDLRNGLDHPATPAAIDALARAVKGEQPAAQTPQGEPLCPYRGLEPFHEDDAALFFGRAEFAEALMQKVLAQPLVAVVGPSGSGKSSVVQAGLLPRLRRACWPNQTWEAIVFTPREQPFHSLAKELLPLYEPVLDKTERMMAARKLGEALAAGRIPLDDPIAEALKTVERANRLLLVVDQFEELFTLSEERYRQPFVEALIAAATRADSPVTVVLTLRADFYGQAIGLSRALSDGIQQGLVNLGPMTKDELWQAIVKPAESVGLRFEPGLVERLLVDVLDQPGSLPLLEFALKELWLRRRNGMIVNDQYDEIGKLEGAISKRADAQFERVPPAEREAVLRAFTRLVRVSAANEEGTDTRQRVRLKDLDAAVHPVVKSFVKERLLVMSCDEETSEETVEVAHEALIRRWERLKELLNKDRQFFLWRQRLGLMLSEWQRTKRDAGALLRGAPLNEAKRWLKDREKDLNQQEREFIQQSELAVPKPLRRIAAVAGFVLIVALAAFGWKLWDDRDESQINKILPQSSELVRVVSTNNNISHNEIPETVASWVRTLAATGRSTEALEAAREIEDASYRTQAMVSIVKALAKANKIDGALEMARKIEDENSRAEAMVSIIEALAKANKADEASRVASEAFKVAREIEYASSRTQAMVSIVKTLAKANAADETSRIASEAFEVARKLEDENSRAEAMVSIIEALAKANKADEASRVASGAFEVARKIESVSSRNQAMVSIVKALAKANKIDGALEMAREIEYASSRAEAMVSIVEVLAKANKADEALEAARKIESAYYRTQAMVSIVKALAKVNKIDEALEVAREVEYAFSYTQAMVSIVEALAKANKIDEALKVARKIEGADSCTRAMVSIIEALAKANRADEASRVASEALEVARKIEDTYFRAQAMVSIVKALVKANAADETSRIASEAFELARKIGPLHLRSQAMVNVIETLAKANKADEVLEMVRKIESADTRAEVMVRAADALANTHQAGKAKSTLAEAQLAAQQIPTDHGKSMRLADVGIGLAKLHYYRLARETANLCASSSDKLAAYTAILREYYIERHPEQAKLFEEEPGKEQ